MHRIRIALVATAAGCALLFPSVASAGPVVSVTPSSLQFGGVCVGAPTDVQTITVQNTGDGTLQIIAIELDGANPGDFQLSGSSPRSLAPAASMSFGVKFTPFAAGDRSAFVRISSNAPSSPNDVPVSGSGVTRTLDVSPDRLAFGEQRTGTSSDDLVLSLASVGGSAVTVSKVTATGQHASDFIVKGPAVKRLEPGRDSIVSVVFRPKAGGERRGAVTIESDACAGRTTIALAGTGTAPHLKVNPSPIGLGTAAVGETAPSVPVVIANDGRAALRITDIAVEGAQSQDFRFDSFPSLPKVLGPGEEFLVNATFAPSAPGMRRAILRITSDDPVAPSLAVEMTGNLGGAGSPSPSASPSASSSGSPSPAAGGGSSGGRAVHSGAGDWIAVAVVASAVGGIFAGLFAIRRRRAFDA